jgi:ribonucleoside-diphosphate reductase alpha chain
MVSAVFRRTCDVGFVAEELKAVFDPRGGAWIGGRYVPSLLAAVGDIVERHLNDLGTNTGSRSATSTTPCLAALACPQCGAQRLVKVEGCNNCLDCGYSRCA